MQTSQLACPHCGSMLNFGVEIAAGTPVECLICMQSFIAQTTITPGPSAAPTTNQDRRCSIDSADHPTLSDSDTKSIPKTTPMSAALKAKSQAKSTGSQDAKDSLTTKATSSSQPLQEKKDEQSSPAAVRTTVSSPSTRAKRGRSPSSTGGQRLAMIGLVMGLLLLVGGGLGLAAWKFSNRGKGPVNEDENPSELVEVKKSELEKDKVLVPVPMVKIDRPPVESDPPPVTTEDEEAIRKAKEAEGKLLTRKNTTVTANVEPSWDEVKTPLDVKKQLAWGLDQEKINAAIAQGVVYLKSNQNGNGTWLSDHGVGHAAIGGLTLLECKVPASDPAIQNAANYVRSHTANLDFTYELSLAILFLDRLSDPRDRGAIQGMALRLLAGQNECGGWTYHCPKLDSQEMFQLYAFLQSNKKPTFFNPLGDGTKLPSGITRPGPIPQPITQDPGRWNDPFQQLSSLILTKAIENTSPLKPSDPTNPLKETKPENATDPEKPVLDPKNPSATKKSPEKKVVPIRAAWLKPNLQKLTVVLNQGKEKGQFSPRVGPGDNSNTQFALLALWAARRHEVPTESALLMAYQRFTGSQKDDGGWCYFPFKGNSTSSMTCVGLLGLGIGHGTAPEILRGDPNNHKEIVIKPALQDGNIQNGLKALARSIGDPTYTQRNIPMENLYFMWSVERVAMLFDVKTIDGKDWYGWGAQILVHNQRKDGAWPISSHYHGSNPHINTCFALLFLKRSNLVQDLTNHLRLQSGISDPNR